MEIWRALAGFEELLEAMDHRFLELWESENAGWEVDTAARHGGDNLASFCTVLWLEPATRSRYWGPVWAVTWWCKTA